MIENYQGKVYDLNKEIVNFMCNIHHYPKEWPLYQKVHHELYRAGSSEPVVCPVCQTTMKFKGLREGYPKNCSYKCRSRNSETLDKYKNSCMKTWGTEYASQSPKFRDNVKQTCLSNWGVDNPAKTAEVRDKIKKTNLKKYGSENPSNSKIVTDKIRKAFISKGLWVDDSQRSDLEKYRLEVKKISKKSYHDYFYVINPQNLPRSRYQWHLDHIFSVEEGFKQRVPPEVIGHWTNLRMLWHLDNSKKNTKCDKTIEQLFEDYHSVSAASRFSNADSSNPLSSR